MAAGNTWYFTQKELSLAYGADYKTEVANRRATIAFLQETGMNLRLPQLTIATAIVFFHRFFVRHALTDFDRHVVAATSLFLAGKVEETPKKLRDVINVAHHIRHKNTPELKPDSQEFYDIREQILYHERVVLQTIAFDLQIEHPYKFLLTYIKTISGRRNLAQVAWNFVNDSLRTNLCLQYRPQLIASAAIYLASKFLKEALPTEGKKSWWELLDANVEELEDISNQILDLYESTPNLNALKSTGSLGEGPIGLSIFTSPSTPPNALDPPPPPPPDLPPPPPLLPPPPPSQPPPPDQPPPPPSQPPPARPPLPSPQPPTDGIPPPPAHSPKPSPANGKNSSPPTQPSTRSSGSPRSRSHSLRSSRSPSRRSRSPRKSSRSPRKSSRSPRKSSRSPTRRGSSRSPRRGSRSPRRSPRDKRNDRHKSGREYRHNSSRRRDDDKDRDRDRADRDRDGRDHRYRPY